MSLQRFSSPGLAEPGRVSQRERAEQEQKSTREQVERWLTACVAQSRAQIPIKTAEPPPSAWRPGASDLTGYCLKSAAEVGAPRTADAAGAELPSRMLVRVDAGELGELALRLERTAAGMRVVIGVETAAARTAVMQERGTLVEVLRQSGMTVESVSIVAAAELGTVLAPHGFGTARVGHRAAAAGNPDELEPERKRNARRLNLKG